MIRIGVLGATGRMGKMVLDLAAQDSDLEVTAKASRQGGIEDLAQTDVVVDFSLPEGTLQWVDHALNLDQKIPALVSGATGWTDEQMKKLTEYGKRAPVVHSPNFSVGVMLTHQLLEQAAKQLKPLGYSAKINDVHHIHKKDTPSGTALSLQKSLDHYYDQPTSIDSKREGEVVGTHEIVFTGADDEITIRHVAKSRQIFARGAIQAAKWMVNQRRKVPSLLGLFGMADLFDLDN